MDTPPTALHSPFLRLSVFPKLLTSYFCTRFAFNKFSQFIYKDPFTTQTHKRFPALFSFRSAAGLK